VEEGLLLNEPGIAAATRVEGCRRHQGKEGLAGGQGTLICEAQEFLAALCREDRPGLLPLSYPFALGLRFRGHSYPPWLDRVLMRRMIYDRGRFINHPSMWRLKNHLGHPAKARQVA